MTQPLPGQKQRLQHHGFFVAFGRIDLAQAGESGLLQRKSVPATCSKKALNVKKPRVCPKS
jgi:hypothetical protein